MKEYTVEDFMPTQEELETRMKIQKQMDLREKYREAIDAGDEKEQKRLASLIKLSPSMASTIKNVMGLDTLKSMGFDMSEVVAKFGEDYLDKENERYYELNPWVDRKESNG